VEELLFERGVVVSYETIRAWCLTFGPAIAAALKRRRPQPTGAWHLDELFIKMPGKTYDLRRAVEADGLVLDILRAGAAPPRGRRGRPAACRGRLSRDAARRRDR
jgi:putative transposase